MRIKQQIYDISYLFEYLCALLRRLNIAELEELIKLINSSVHYQGLKLTYNGRSHSISIAKNQDVIAILTKTGVTPIQAKANIA